MMNKSFVLYTEYGEKLKRLSDDQLGALFRRILCYEAGEDLPPTNDIVVDMAFDFIRGDLDRQAENYRRKVEAGRKGGETKAKHRLAQASTKLAEASTTIADASTKLAKASTEKQTASKSYLNKDKDKDKDKTKDKTNNKYIPTRFSEFWDAYPRKVAKAPAEQAYNKKAVSPAAEQNIIDALHKVISAQWDHWPAERKQYIPYAATWLNQQRYTDDIRTETKEPEYMYAPIGDDSEATEEQKDALAALLAKLNE